MRIKLSNIAAMRRADIEIDGITVVAGENDTGKSTISKALWCMFDSFYKYEQQFDAFRYDAVEDAVRLMLPSQGDKRLGLSFVTDAVARELNERSEMLRSDMSLFYKIIEQAYQRYQSLDDAFEGVVDRQSLEPLRKQIESILSYDDSQLLSGVLEKNFLSEFSRQFCNVDNPNVAASVTLTIQGRPLVASIAHNKVLSISSLEHLDVRAIYIDNAFILDEVARETFFFRRRPRGIFDEDRHQRLKRLLRAAQRDDGNVLRAMMTDDRISEILEQIGRALPGDLKRNGQRELLYVPAGYSESIDASAISAGMKIFCMLELLLKNGSIERKSTIILDEPEVHLHPEWQLVFAELIVLLQKTFDLHVLLTTHSPYFLRAIQVYAAKHSIATRCRYYQAEREGKWCVTYDVTNKTEVIFDKLTRPFEILDAEASRL